METRLKISGMNCMHCVGAVRQALEKVPGVQAAEVSLEKERAVVRGSAGTAALLEAVRKAGFEAED